MADAHNDAPDVPSIPKPDVALPAVPLRAAEPAIGNSASGMGARDRATVGPTPAPASERDIATITTLQRRADELAAEHHHGSDALAFAAAAAATLAEVAHVTGADVERARGPERSTEHADHERSRLESASLANQSVDAIASDAPSANPVLAGEIAATGDALSPDLDGPSVGSDPFDAYLPDVGDDIESGFEPDLGLIDRAPDARGTGPAEVGIPHDGATPWNGQTSIGTISYVEGDRAEQYAGRGSWMSFSISKDLGGVRPEVGQSVQINSDGTMQATPEQQLAQSQTLTLDRGRALT